MVATNYHYDRLQNGLRILTIPMRERNSVAVSIWIKVGSRYEKKRISGISHFLEHMLFKGTRKRSTRQIKESIEGIGGTLNAFTGEESTCYYAKLLKNHYAVALEVLADMVANATFPQAELAKERPVILEEIKMYTDQPSQYVFEMLGELLWPKQSLGRPIAGNLKSVAAITRTDLLQFRDRHYHPANILVAVSGPIEHQNIVSQSTKLFSKIKAKRESAFEAATLGKKQSRFRYLRKPIEQSHIAMGFPTLSRFHPDRYALGTMNVILGANMSSRLFEEVREQRGLAYEIRSGLNYFEDTGCLYISAGVETSKTPKTIGVVLNELEKLKHTKVRETELRRAKDYFISQLMMTLEDNLDHLLWAGERILLSDQLPDPEKIRKAIERVTVEDVLRIAKRYFDLQRLSLAVISPGDDALQKKIEHAMKVS